LVRVGTSAYSHVTIPACPSRIHKKYGKNHVQAHIDFHSRKLRFSTSLVQMQCECCMALPSYYGRTAPILSSDRISLIALHIHSSILHTAHDTHTALILQVCGLHVQSTVACALRTYCVHTAIALQRTVPCILDGYVHTTFIQRSQCIHVRSHCNASTLILQSYNIMICTKTAFI
jgi:hypothetical protein